MEKAEVLHKSFASHSSHIAESRGANPSDRESRVSERPPHEAECVQVHEAGLHASQGPEGTG